MYSEGPGYFDVQRDWAFNACVDVTNRNAESYVILPSSEVESSLLNRKRSTRPNDADVQNNKTKHIRKLKQIKLIRKSLDTTILRKICRITKYQINI